MYIRIIHPRLHLLPPHSFPNILVPSFLLLFIFIPSICNCRDISSVIATFGKEQHIRGLASTGDGHFVVVVNHSVLLFPLNGTTINPLQPIWQIPISDDLDSPPIDFQIAPTKPNHTLIICTKFMCKICRGIEPKYALDPKNCTIRSFILPIRSVKIVSSDEGRLFLRVLLESGTAMITAFDWNPSMSTSSSVDDHTIHDQTVVSGFRHDSYAYFVGSATRVNWPLKVTDDLPEDPPRVDVRLSRVCLRDRTQKRGPPLGSRMELTLSCQGLEHTPLIPTSQKSRAIAATKTLDEERLLVVIELNSNRQLTPLQLVCQYRLDELDARFDQTWETCKKTNTTSEQTIAECRANAKQMVTNNCYMAYWMPQQGGIRVCHALSVTSDANCQNAYYNTPGWMEDFRPFQGTVVASFPNAISPILQISPDPSGKAFWLMRQDGTIERWLIEQKSASSITDRAGNPVWSMFTKQQFGSFDILLEAPRSFLLFKGVNEIRRLPLNCATLYPMCEDIAWSDPLECRWCAHRNLSGHTVSALDIAKTNVATICPEGIVMTACPLNITKVEFDTENGLLKVHGTRLNTLDKLRVSFCVDECSKPIFNADLIQCTINLTNLRTCQTLTLSGAFDNVSNLTFVHEMSNMHLDEDIPSSILLVLVIMAVIVLLLLLLFFCVYRKFHSRFTQWWQNRALNRGIMAMDGNETKHSVVYYRKRGGKGESLNEEVEASYTEVL